MAGLPQGPFVPQDPAPGHVGADPEPVAHYLEGQPPHRAGELVEVGAALAGHCTSQTRSPYMRAPDPVYDPYARLA